MSTTIAETFDRERMRAGLTAGAATVGRPTGVEGKNRTPRRAKMTSKEVDHIKTRAGIKAGGPGSGRKPEWSTKKGVHTDADTKQLDQLHQNLTKAGYKFKYSSGDKQENGLVTHVYHKGDPTMPSGRTSQYIWERQNGNHTSSLK